MRFLTSQLQPSRFTIFAVVVAACTLSAMTIGCGQKPTGRGNAETESPGYATRPTPSRGKSTQQKEPDLPRPPGMVWIPGGQFVMGAENSMAREDEKPKHLVHVDGFYMNIHEITNDQFAKFVEETGYMTTAEKIPKLEDIQAQQPPGSPPVDPAMLTAGSLVFNPPSTPVATDIPNAHYQWWQWSVGTNWRHPEGPESNINDRGNHPVVHVSWDDSVAYCKWAGKRLPTESEWEFAARGGLEEKQFVWGSEKASDKQPQANIWQGQFPNRNALIDGYETTSPVGSFPANGFGLFDMPGNVWEWCSDWYRKDAYRQRATVTNETGELIVMNPQGPESTDHPYEPRKVKRGGSFLCHRDYCSSYRPSARMHTSLDTGSGHSGFRPVMTEAMWRAELARQKVNQQKKTP